MDVDPSCVHVFMNTSSKGPNVLAGEAMCDTDSIDIGSVFSGTGLSATLLQDLARVGRVLLQLAPWAINTV